MNVIRFMWQNHTQVLELSLEHLSLVGISTVLAMLIGIPLGIMISHRPRLNKPVLAGANIIQTIPSLRSSVFCFRFRGWATVPSGWPYWLSRFTHCCRSSGTLTQEFAEWILRLWKQAEAWD